MTETTTGAPGGAPWQDAIFEALKAAGVGIVGYVPDAGHAHVIRRARADPAVDAIVLTTEEEGVALAGGAWLGGARSVLLMQSSGVGNCVNMLGLVRSCRFPFVALVTMRGEWEEFNPWQEPMGRAVQPVLEAMGVGVLRARTPDDVAAMVPAALDSAFRDERPVAVLLSQQLIGAKEW